MSINFVRTLPSPEEIKEEFPLSRETVELKKETDEKIRKVFTGESDKFLAVIGPCSADNEDAVLDYVTRLAKVQEKIKDKVIIIPRVYTNKPRTTGDGYKGMLHQPDPEKAPDMVAGIKAIRKLHLDVIKETGFSLRMKCSTLKTGCTAMTLLHTLQSVHVQSRTSSTD